jgi:cytochrome c peroxidase
LPFDADGDGRAQGDERDDMGAGGIGTDALFGYEVDRRALADKNVRMGITRISSIIRRGSTETVQIAGPWVRTAPLTTLAASAPYLHNGSVPTLRALLEPTDRRPVTFQLGQGQGGFTFDTRLPGNRNTGHEFGVMLSAQDKNDLVAFLETL